MSKLDTILSYALEQAQQLSTTEKTAEAIASGPDFHSEVAAGLAKVAAAIKSNHTLTCNDVIDFAQQLRGCNGQR
jgi:hypothetical protein